MARGAWLLAALGLLPAALVVADAPDASRGAAPPAGAPPELLPWVAPPLALLVLGLLLVLVCKEKTPVSDNTPVPQARNGDDALPEGLPLRGAVRTHEGSHVPQAALTLIDATGRQSGRGYSDGEGRFTLRAPRPGAYVLIAAAGGHQPRAVGVTVADQPVELDVVLGGCGQLTGRVLTPEGEPVPEATVTLTDTRGDVVATARSGRAGGYTFPRLVAGEYTLAAGAPAYRPAAVPVSVRGTLPVRQNIELAGRAVLGGTVRGGDGDPVGDARVTLLDAAGTAVETTLTGPDGRFAFNDLSSGQYTVIAAGYPPVASALTVAGGERADHDVHLGHGG